MINPSKFSLSIAVFVTLLKGIWILALMISPRWVQMFLDWVAELHFIDSLLVVHPVEFLPSIVMLCFTFVMISIFSYIFAIISNMIEKNT